MRPRLSYIYTGDKFPDLKNKVVIVGDIASKAGISYTLLKNRMQMKKTRRRHKCVITDEDLAPKKREINRNMQWRRKHKPHVLTLSQKWLRKPII